MPSPVVLKLAHGAHLTAEDRSKLEGLVRDTQMVAPRQDLIREGDRPEQVQVILEGFACRYKQLRDGSRQIMALLVPGDFCDLRVAILGEMDHGIATLSACTVARFSRGEVQGMIAGNGSPGLNQALWWASLVDEAVLREWLVGMGRRQADKRMAHLFCELRVRLGVVGLVIDNGYILSLQQADLADVLGLTTVHVNRVLQTLRTSGLVTLNRKRLSIPDVSQLEAFAEFDPKYLHLTKRSGE